MKDKTIAAILALVLGSLGVHRFYLGNFGMGSLYAIFTMMGLRVLGFPLMAVIGVIDAVRLFTMSQEAFDQKYNKRSLQRRERTRRPEQSQNREMRRKQWRMEREQQRQQQRQGRQQRPSQRRSRAEGKKAEEYKAAGIKHFREYEFEEALEFFLKAQEYKPNDPSLHFNLACTYSVKEDADKALYHLDKAVKNGFKNFEKIKTHDALAFVRVDKRFDDFINGYSQAKSKQANTTKQTPKQQGDNLLDDLRRLAELRRKGQISEEQFVLEKERLMR